MGVGRTAGILKTAHQLPELETPEAVIAQLGERQTEDLEVLGSIPSPGIFYVVFDGSVRSRQSNIAGRHAGLWRSW